MEPDVRFGKPCITGTRVDVATVVGAVGAGESIEAVQEAFELTRDQVPQRSALRSLCCRSPSPPQPSGRFPEFEDSARPEIPPPDLPPPHRCRTHHRPGAGGGDQTQRSDHCWRQRSISSSSPKTASSNNSPRAPSLRSSCRGSLRTALVHHCLGLYSGRRLHRLGKAVSTMLRGEEIRNRGLELRRRWVWFGAHREQPARLSIDKGLLPSCEDDAATRSRHLPLGSTILRLSQLAADRETDGRSQELR